MVCIYLIQKCQVLNIHIQKENREENTALVCILLETFIQELYSMVLRLMSFSGGAVIKNPPTNAGETGLTLMSGRFTGLEMAIHFSILAWRILWTEEPGRLQSMGSQKSQILLSH